MLTPTILIAGPNNWPAVVAAQQQQVRRGEFTRFARLDALVFEITKISNPNMLKLAAVRTPDNRPAWPGPHLDWLNQGPPIGNYAGPGGLIIAANPLPLPPDVPDPTWAWSMEHPAPGRIPQRLEDRAMAVKGTPFIIIQPVVQIQWLLDEARPGRVRREIHEVRPDAGGLSMAFLYDTAQKTGHLVGGQIL
jgi:hypothetical protein